MNLQWRWLLHICTTSSDTWSKTKQADYITGKSDVVWGRSSWFPNPGWMSSSSLSHRQSMQWIHPSSSAARASVFWDAKVNKYNAYLQKATLSMHSIKPTAEIIMKGLKTKHPGKLTKGLVSSGQCTTTQVLGFKDCCTQLILLIWHYMANMRKKKKNTWQYLSDDSISAVDFFTNGIQKCVNCKGEYNEN